MNTTTTPTGWELFKIDSPEAKKLIEQLEIDTMPEEVNPNEDAVTDILISNKLYYILVHSSGKYSTTALKQTAYGSFDECVNLITEHLGEAPAIANIEDAKIFIQDCVKYIGTGFHPDDDFADYIELRDKTAMYSEQAAIQANKQMEVCFELFEQAGQDIYEYALSLL